jgi:HAMP domain-containing protein
MTLRARLLLAFGYLVGLLLLCSISAMFGFLHLSSGIDVVLTENFRTIQASMKMIDTLERMDSATLASLIEGAGQDDEMDQLTRAFLAALGEAEGNVTEEAEPPTLRAIRESFESYRVAEADLVRRRLDRPLADYNEKVFPKFAVVKEEVLGLLEINQQAMIRAEREARRTAIHNGAWLGVLVTVALLSFVFLSRALQSQVLARLADLRRGTWEIASGHMTRRLYCQGDDELAAIAGEINQLLDEHDRLRGKMDGRLARERRLILALVDLLGDRAAIFDLSGELLTGSLGADSAEMQVTTWIRQRVADKADEEQGSATVTSTIGGITIDLLQARPDSPVGWLARVSS